MSLLHTPPDYPIPLLLYYYITPTPLCPSPTNFIASYTFPY